MALAVGVAMLCAPAAADAASLGRFGQYGEGLHYVAGDGEANDVTVTWSADAARITDPGAPSITFAESAASTCRQTDDPHTVECDVTSPDLAGRPRGGESWFDLADGNDRARVDAPSSMNSAATFRGGAGDDRMVGGPGDDRFFGERGFDTYDPGGGGHNILEYTGDLQVTIDLRVPGVAPDNEIIPDGIQAIRTAAGDDILIGDDRPNEFSSGFGKDRLVGNGGDDALVDGSDWSEQNDDVLDGGAGDDYLNAGAGDDLMDGGDGADLLVGADGADDLRGGDGLDTASYSAWDQWRHGGSWPGDVPAVTASIGDGPNDGSADDGPEGARDDVHSDIEILRGTDQSDTLTGDDGPNVIDPGQGGDTVYGKGGDDFVAPTMADGWADHLEGGEGNDVLTVSGWSAFADGGDGDDVLMPASGPARFTKLLGGAGRDRLYGGGWDVTLDGGPDDDLVATRDHYLAGGTCGDGNDRALLDDPSEEPFGVADSFTDCEDVALGDPLDSGAEAAVPREDEEVTLSRWDGSVGVRSPRAGPVLIEKLGRIDGDAPQPAAVPMQVDVRAPEPALGDAIVARFVILEKVLPASVEADSVDVYLDGVPLLPCAGDVVPPTGACVKSRKRIDSYQGDSSIDQDLEVVVRSTRGGRFTFGHPAIEVPKPPASDPPAGPGPAVDPPAEGEDTVAPRLRIGRIGGVRLAAVAHRGLVVPLRCSERCTATTQLVIGGREAKPLRLAAVVGRSRASVSGARRVRVKLTRAATRRLARAKSLRLTVRASAVDGAGNRSKTASTVLRLR